MTDLPPLGPKGGKGVGMKGLVVVDTYRGQIRTRSWPKKRGPKKTAAQQVAVDRFTAAIELIKRLEPGYWKYAYELTKGSPFMPRDFMLMALTGRYAMFVDPQGKKIYPFAYMADVSEALDSISQEPGTLLIRGEEAWIAVLGGTPGQILEWEDFPDGPRWVRPSIAVNDAYIGDVNIGSGSFVFSPGFIGTRGYVLDRTEVLTGLEVWANIASATTHLQPVIYACGPTGLATTLLGSGPVVTGCAAGRNVYPFTAPVTVVGPARVYAGFAVSVANWNLPNATSNGQTSWSYAGGALPNPAPSGQTFAVANWANWRLMRVLPS